MVQNIMKDYKVCQHRHIAENPTLMCDCFTKEEREKYLFRFHNSLSGCKNPDHKKFGKHNVWYLANIPTWKDSCFVPLTHKEDQEKLQKICKLLDVSCQCQHQLKTCCLCHHLSNPEEPPKLYITLFERWSLAELIKLFPYIDWDLFNVEYLITAFSRLFVSCVDEAAASATIQ